MKYFPLGCSTECPHFKTWDMSVDDWTSVCDILKVQIDDCDGDYIRYKCPLDSDTQEDQQMIHVCFMESGKQYLLAEFETMSEAEEFIKHDAILYYADEINEDEDVVIAKERMFIEKEGCKCISL